MTTIRKLLLCLTILIATSSSFAKEDHELRNKLPLVLDRALGFGAVDPSRGGWEIGNHRWVENLTGFYRFAVYEPWISYHNEAFTEVYPEDSETYVEVDVRPDVSFQSVAEYVQYMAKRGWTPITEGPHKGKAVRGGDVYSGDEFIESTVRLYKKPGETVVFKFGANETAKFDISRVNRVLNTFELIPNN